MEKCFKQKLSIIKFPTKNLRERIPLSTLDVELKGSKDLPFLKYYNAQERECIFTRGLNNAKDTDYIKKLFKQKLRKIEFPAKNWWKHISICPRDEAREQQKFAVFEILYCAEMGEKHRILL